MVGATGTGKSQLTRLLALSAFRHGRGFIIDPAGSSLTELPGAVTFYDSTRRTNEHGQDWTTAHIARYVPLDPFDLDGYDRVFAWAWSVRDQHGAAVPMWGWVDEGGSVIPVNKRKDLEATLRYIVQGRKRALGLTVDHTRPRELDTNALAQAANVFAFWLPNPADRVHVAGACGIKPAVYEDLNAQLEAQHAALVAAGQASDEEPPHGFIYRGPGRPPRLCAPLPPALLANAA